METNEYTVTTREGYMGATAWDGCNSHRHLYGASLSKAIREEIRRNKIKGITVSSETYSGGQSLKIKMKVSEEDFIPFDEYRAKKLECINFAQFGDWFWHKGRRISCWDCSNLPDEERYALYDACIKEHYDRLHNLDRYGEDLLPRRLDLYRDRLAPQFLKKFELVRKIVDSFNYDESNSMVDYHDRGFYETYTIVPKKPQKEVE